MRWHLWVSAGLIIVAGWLIWASGRTISSSPSPAATRPPLLGVDLEPITHELRTIRDQLATLQPTVTRTPRPPRTATPRPTDYPQCAEAHEGQACYQHTPTAMPPTVAPATATPTLLPCGTRLNGEYPELCRKGG
jgi:hypothetical protein